MLMLDYNISTIFFQKRHAVMFFQVQGEKKWDYQKGNYLIFSSHIVPGVYKAPNIQKTSPQQLTGNNSNTWKQKLPTQKQTALHTNCPKQSAIINHPYSPLTTSRPTVTCLGHLHLALAFTFQKAKATVFKNKTIY